MCLFDAHTRRTMKPRANAPAATSAPATPAAAGAGALLSIPFETQGERRRRQLVRAAAMLIESEGLDNLRMGDVAKVAGCSRQVAHNYFPQRDDLLRAVVIDFYGVLERKLGEFAEVATDGSGSGPAELEVWAQRVADAAWNLIEEEGLGGLMLIVSADASPAVKDQVRQLRQPYVDLWKGFIESVLPHKIDAEIIIELWFTAYYQLTLKWRSGEVTRAEGATLLIRYCVSILHAFSQSE